MYDTPVPTIKTIYVSRLRDVQIERWVLFIDRRWRRESLQLPNEQKEFYTATTAASNSSILWRSIVWWPVDAVNIFSVR
jgi:hypothetical protein